MIIRNLAASALFGASLLCSAGAPAIDTPSPASAGDPAAALIERGGYVALLADCTACHTAPQGKPLAGGVELKTPFGSLYSTNITSDAQTGIGRHTYEQFERAMRRGVAADGRNLYPAMPYPSYAKMTDEDLRALYAYLSRSVAPVAQASKPADMAWPFSMRWGLALWNKVFLDAAPFTPDASRDAVWNRGAYLVQGPAHCGACHTPRGLAFQEKAARHDGPNGDKYLAGETIEGWRALSLRNLWTADDIVVLLKTGQNRYSAVSGSMVEVIHHSTQHFTDADLVAIATYLTSLPPGRDAPPAPAEPAQAAAPVVPAGLYTTAGGLGYAQFCVDCHRQDGAGVKGVFPSLVQNPSIASADPATLLHIALTGWATARTAAHPRVYTMPAFTRLTDQEVADIVNFVRESWGDKAKAVTASAVKAARVRLGVRVKQGAAFETPRFAAMLAQPNAQQLVRGMRLHLETKAMLPQNVGNALTCSSCHLNAGTVADGSPFIGVAAFFPGYAPRAGRVISLEDRINGCFLRSMNGKPLPAASEEMKAMVAYFEWMKGAHKAGDKIAGRGVGTMDRSIRPDPDNGRRVYEAQCASCHGRDGEGLRQADGRYVYPPLWGEHSFNIGAGMARTYTAAAFVKRNMPIGAHAAFPLGQGGLSDREAVDVAEYFSHQPRPDFAPKAKDWPKDPKPADARY